MLSAQSVPVVRATLPVVGEALGEITECFYRRMFDAEPELRTDLFNRGNQASGEQQKALAGSIARFAGLLLDQPDTRPDALLTRIAHKHASLGITSAQYKIVHLHLFAALAEVLGDAVTDEVAAAWDEVYWLMADALIAAESRLYREAGAAEGEVWRRMVITERVAQTPEVVSFTLRPVDGGAPARFLPGQYVSVQVQLPDGARQIRQYSLSVAPGEQWRISVKRVRGSDTSGALATPDTPYAPEAPDTPAADPDGEVSSWLHQHAHVGDELTVSAPFGDLVLPEGDGPLLLASAGIGNTPMLAMLGHLAATGSRRQLLALHADRAPEHHAHREEHLRLLRDLPHAQTHLWYEARAGDVPEAQTGRTDLGDVELPDDLTACLCGPLPFLQAVRQDLLRRGVPAERVRYEVFGPDLWLGR